MKNKLLQAVLLFLLVTTAYAVQTDVIIESQTPQTLNYLKAKATKEHIASLEFPKIMEWTALQLVGKPYEVSLLDRRDPEYLYISLNQTDCMLFIEEVLVMSRLIKENRVTLTNFVDGIRQVRYHDDVAYCNRNHYFKDWALENQKKHIVKDLAYPLTKQALPFNASVLGAIVSTPGNPHFADKACILNREATINQEQLGFIPIKDLPKYKNDIQSGDIIGVVRTPSSSADSIHHLGIAYVHDGVVGFINASSKYGNKVVIGKTLRWYLEQFKDVEGIVLIRGEPGV